MITMKAATCKPSRHNLRLSQRDPVSTGFFLFLQHCPENCVSVPRGGFHA
jgi:hypothetical protein